MIGVIVVATTDRPGGGPPTTSPVLLGRRFVLLEGRPRPDQCLLEVPSARGRASYNFAGFVGAAPSPRSVLVRSLIGPGAMARYFGHADGGADEETGESG